MIVQRAVLLRRLGALRLPLQDAAACGWLSASPQHEEHFHADTTCAGRQDITIVGDGTEDRDKNYIDRLKIVVRAGKGGNGCVSFWRSATRGKHVPADGGNGGDGGGIILRASSDMKSLAGVQQLYQGHPGGNGGKQKMHGRAGKDTVVLVPVGTVVSKQVPLPDETETTTSEPKPAAAVDDWKYHGSSGSKEAPAVVTEPSTPSSTDNVGTRHHHLPRMHLRRRQQHGGAAGAAESVHGSGAGLRESDAAVKEDLRPAAEEEMPDWLKRWRQPWVGERDYKSDEESDFEDGVEEESSLAGKSGREMQDDYEVVADLVKNGQEIVIARGGRGGRGNAAYRAAPNRPAPRLNEKGTEGERCKLSLELKLLADVGLVGLPNAGKSTLLRAISNATPRVGSYAFTTLKPQLGVVELPGDTRIVVADIPGLIEGASENRGLGHHFLRHIERTKALAYIVDASAGLDGNPGIKPWDQLDLLQHEILEYSEHLDTLPALVVANKVDLLPGPALVLRDLQRRTDLPVVTVSAKEHVGIEEMLEALMEVVQEAKH